MRRTWQVLFVVLPIIVVSASARASDSARVDSTVRAYDDSVRVLDAVFGRLPANPKDTVWVVCKLSHMGEVDQLVRNTFMSAGSLGLGETERRRFEHEFLQRMKVVDARNLADLKRLLVRYPWFPISKFDQAPGSLAWMIAQHADDDPALQRMVLKRMEKLLPEHDADPMQYSCLWDRVAVSLLHPKKRTLQRYGTQGRCVDGKWVPFPVEDPDHLDARRHELGLDPEATYAASMSCR